MSRPPRLLFVYGTLLFPEVLTALLGRCPPARPARLHGHRRLALRGRDYPALVAAEGHTVEGMLLAVTAAELARLDAYEAEEYRRVAVRVEDGAGAAPVAAWVYLWNGPAGALAERDWDAPDWRRRHGGRPARVPGARRRGQEGIGGRCWDRTSDPCRVRTVLSR